MNVSTCYGVTMARKPTMTKKTRKTPRVVRSISFLPECLGHLVARAAAESRSVNWLVNDLARKDAAKR